MKLPEIIINQKKDGWGGCWEYVKNESNKTYMENVIDKSKYFWVKKLTKPNKRDYQIIFKEYSLVLWLEKNCKLNIKRNELTEFLKKQKSIKAKTSLATKKIFIKAGEDIQKLKNSKQWRYGWALTNPRKFLKKYFF